jgi:hypothetical protein
VFERRNRRGVLATVIEKNEDTMDLNINLFQPSGPQSEKQGFKKSKNNVTRMPMKNVIQIVTTLEQTTRRSRTFKIKQVERDAIESRFSVLMQNG